MHKNNEGFLPFSMQGSDAERLLGAKAAAMRAASVSPGGADSASGNAACRPSSSGSQVPNQETLLPGLQRSACSAASHFLKANIDEAATQHAQRLQTAGFGRSWQLVRDELQGVIESCELPRHGSSGQNCVWHLKLKLAWQHACAELHARPPLPCAGVLAGAPRVRQRRRGLL